MKHVLVISNDPITRLENADLPVGSGFRLVHETGAMEALIMLNRGSFDAVIVDEQLYDLGGYKVCRKIRQYWDIPIIMVGTEPPEKALVNARNFGFDVYLKKPIKPSELLFHIKAILESPGTPVSSGQNLLSETLKSSSSKIESVRWRHTIKCPECGSQNSATYQFCAECGSALNATTISAATAPTTTGLAGTESNATSSLSKIPIAEAKTIDDAISYLENRLNKIKAILDKINQLKATINEANNTAQRQKKEINKMADLLEKAKNQLDEI